ncbi:hypothetical protein [Sorangium sp. So ce381]|uniref:hypothetical protein n=1 Tax=unclassified Sorangium TaxID=2621164 RepID=UPI003F5CB68F
MVPKDAATITPRNRGLTPNAYAKQGRAGMSDHEERAELLADHRPELARLLQRLPARSSASSPLAGYLLSLREPTGYLIAIGLQQRDPALEPERVLRSALAAGERAPMLVGVMARSAMAEIIAPLAPVTRAVAARLKRPAPSGTLRVVVAAAGGAELFTVKLSDLTSLSSGSG